MSFLSLGFAQPLMLTALVVLPAIWWLLRFVPPRPRQITFPPLRFLLALRREDEKPQTSPWWLTALRLTIAACIILALAGPTFDPQAKSERSRGPLVLIIDNGWPAASSFDLRKAGAQREIEDAIEASRPVLLLATSLGADQSFRPLPASEARERLRGLNPEAFIPDRRELASALVRTLQDLPEANVVWLADGLANGEARALADVIAKALPPSRITLIAEDTLNPLILGPATNGSEALSMSVMRIGGGATVNGNVRAYDSKGRSIAAAPYSFEARSDIALTRFELPVELRNDIFRLEIDQAGNAGAVQLLDDRWRRRTIGLYAGIADYDNPLLSPLFILSQALQPFADTRVSSAAGTGPALADFFDQKVAVLVLADVSSIPLDVQPRLERWLKGGGVLVRFAGTRLANQRNDTFIPVKLRQTTRVLGGTLSWEQPQLLGRFSPTGPFAGMALPTDVTINRQILAEPDPDLPGKTWVELADGTPLVTAEARGDGHVVLVHVTADPNWSNLPLSGTFLEMLRRIIVLSAAHNNDERPHQGAEALLPPLRLLDAKGHSIGTTPNAKPIAISALGKTPVSRDYPPGIYGREEAFRAHNTVQPGDQFSALPTDLLPPGIARRGLGSGRETALSAWFLVAGLALFLVDALIILTMSGAWSLRRPIAASIAFLSFVLIVPPDAHAQNNRQRNNRANAPPLVSANPIDSFALNAANRTRLAYVLTGNTEIDEVSRQGLMGLTRVLTERTSLEPAEPVGVDLAHDELAFFPMIYWPIDVKLVKPPPAALTKADQFMKNGGTILFDTRDQGAARPAPRGGIDTPGLAKLREILVGFDVPELEPIPSDHVLTKAFYLLAAFPGRFEDGPLWTEKTLPNPTGAKRPVRLADGVTPILITTNDLAGAWASDQRGNALLPTYGENPRQREFALRAGVNIVIYLLTGNYKADQVHVDDILQRLGQ